MSEVLYFNPQSPEEDTTEFLSLSVPWIYSVPWNLMRDTKYLEIIEKYVLRHMIIEKPSKSLKEQIKKELELYLKPENMVYLKHITFIYLEFLEQQKQLFGEDFFYDFSFNKSNRGFQLTIKRPTIDVSTSTDILSTSVYDLLTSSSLYPILKITPDNYVDEIKKLAATHVIFDEQKLIDEIKQKAESTSFDNVRAQIAMAYIARIDEYKVHLQVKPEYQFWVLHKLNWIIRDNETFRSCIDAIKMHNFYDIVIGETRAPSIVIYLSGNNLKQTSQEKIDCLKNVLIILRKVFGKYSYKIGLDITPRYNYKVDELIYFTNGPGDVKAEMQKDNVLDEYFTESSDGLAYNYSFLKSNKEILTECIKCVFGN